ncbi:hypothetical protein BDM02DRAFT_3122266 [Thelephora ganbajun]|uniref:Uncharacterized protein n=1 Tax=Thelephora ganbajun TaxID=370292 RepID=A0ACB6Z3X5_THEGA|nr:hypothetical protein BDM02DRAFT_3122266 [Thelephora ganbajun]
MEGPTFCDLTPHERLETIPVPKSWPGLPLKTRRFLLRPPTLSVGSSVLPATV